MSATELTRLQLDCVRVLAEFEADGLCPCVEAVAAELDVDEAIAARVIDQLLDLGWLAPGGALRPLRMPPMPSEFHVELTALGAAQAWIGEAADAASTRQP